MHGRSDRGHPNLTMDPVEDSEPPNVYSAGSEQYGKSAYLAPASPVRRGLFAVREVDIGERVAVGLADGEAGEAHQRQTTYLIRGLSKKNSQAEQQKRSPDTRCAETPGATVTDHNRCASADS